MQRNMRKVMTSNKKINNVGRSLAIRILVSYLIVTAFFLYLSAGNYVSFKDPFIITMFVFFILVVTLISFNDQLFIILKRRYPQIFNEIVYLDLGDYIGPLFHINNWFKYVWFTKHTDKDISLLAWGIRLSIIFLIIFVLYYLSGAWM